MEFIANEMNCGHRCSTAHNLSHLFTEDLLFTKAYKAIETQFGTVHSLVHAQLNARAVGGCFEIL
jgi:hypothetical protein